MIVRFAFGILHLRWVGRMCWCGGNYIFARERERERERERIIFLFSVVVVVVSSSCEGKFGNKQVIKRNY